MIFGWGSVFGDKFWACYLDIFFNSELICFLKMETSCLTPNFGMAESNDLGDVRSNLNGSFFVVSFCYLFSIDWEKPFLCKEGDIMWLSMWHGKNT